MNHIYKTTLDETDSRFYVTNAGEKYFYYDCLCVKCGDSHTAGFPQKPFLQHLIESKFLAPTANTKFFFLNDDMQIKMMDINGKEYNVFQDCPISDDDFDLKNIIE